MMQKIPFFHSYNTKTKHLKLRGAHYVPKEIVKFSDDIEILDLNDGLLTALPDELPQLKKLKILFCSNNPFTKVPKILAQCEQLYMLGFKACQLTQCDENVLPLNLRWLVLTDNNLPRLPNSIGKLKYLQKVSLTGNQLSSLPETMQACKAIEFLRISANNFTETPPGWIFKLPKLAWYGDNGNPFCEQYKTRKIDLPEISCEDLIVGELLGQSPSSEVFKATLKATKQPVAVKLYRGQLTSDGYPADDMYAAMAAGDHKNLIKILGTLVDVPDGRKGLVFELIPKSFCSLGLPPSLSSCTRDTYQPGSCFSLSQIEQILRNIAAASKHLHKQGMAHGDLYAHNILTDSSGQSFLGDFGAVSFYDASQSDLRERIDVRAFGCLIEELLLRCDNSGENQAKVINNLKQLRHSCQQANIYTRPLFETMII